MKGSSGMIIAIVVILAVLVVATNPGVLRTMGLASTTDCKLLLPQYATYRCELGAGDSVRYTDSDGYGCGWGVHCVSVHCGAQPAFSGGSMCTIRAMTDNMFVQVAGGQVVALTTGATATAEHSELIVISRLGGNIDFKVEYPTKFMEWQDWRTGKTLRADGCNVFSMNTNLEAYKMLPTDAQFALEPGESQTYVSGFDEFPIWGNYATFDGRQVVCEMNADKSATLYELEILETKGAGCYVYPGTPIKDVECCPGWSFGSNVCNRNFKYDVIDEETGETASGVDIGCCHGGICSPVWCPGEGGWDEEGCLDPPCDIFKYECLETGVCRVSDTKSIDCRRDRDCDGEKVCDTGTGKCVTMIVPVSCTTAGHTCCVEGMFASNVGLRTCQEAGFAEDFVCVNGECVAGEIAEEAGICAWWDIVCHLQGFWASLIAWLTGTFAAIGVIAVIVIILFGAFMFLKPR